jgi:ankyrin repeat protein
VLIQNGADVNAVDEGKDTALHYAAMDGYLDVAKLLLKNGADVNAVQKDKLTALRIAASKKHIPCTLQLLCFGAGIDDETIEDDKTKLLRPIEGRLKLLRDGNQI